MNMETRKRRYVLMISMAIYFFLDSLHDESVINDDVDDDNEEGDVDDDN